MTTRLAQIRRVSNQKVLPSEGKECTGNRSPQVFLAIGEDSNRFFALRHIFEKLAQVEDTPCQGCPVGKMVPSSGRLSMAFPHE